MIAFIYVIQNRKKHNNTHNNAEFFKLICSSFPNFYLEKFLTF